MKTTIVTGNTIMRPVTAGQSNLTCLDRQGNVTRSGRQTGGKAAVNKQPGSKVAVNKQMSSKPAVINQPDDKAKGVIYGYIRVSTREQNEARQVDAMKKFGVDQMVMDKQSGKDFDRPAYQALFPQVGS